MPQEFKPQYNFTDDRLNELKQLFPEAWEDGVFNVDTLKTLIGDFSTDNTVKEHFSLNWVGKQDARKIAAKPPTGTLKPCLGEGVNEDTTENIFIEGENLEVLKILRKSYMGKIKMIYIDPPYNTGSDFIYNDSFADSTEDYLRKTGEKSDEGLLVSNPKSSGKYHANWLSFMYPRLRLAKDLLKEDGVIFISIDDNEADNLKKVCDEVFGEENFIAKIPWKKRTTKSDVPFGISQDFEWIISYAKPLFLAGLEHKRKYHYSDDYPNDGWRLSDLTKQTSEAERPNSAFNLIDPKNNKEYKYNPNRVWSITTDTFKKYYDAGKIVFPGDYDFLKIKIPSWRVFESEDKEKAFKKFGSENQIKSVSTLLPKEVGMNEDGNKEIVELFGKKIFSFPKPINLLKHLLKIINDKDAVILDFFAGSGTMSQAILEINNEDNGKRVCILNQLPEKCNPSSEAYNEGYQLITEITKQRFKRAIKEIDNTQGFKVYKQDNSTIYKWQDFKSEKDGALPDLFSKMELAYKNPLQDGVTTQDFITEVILQEGFPLTAKQEEVTSGIFKITHEWVPYTLYATMLYSFKNTDFGSLQLEETDHFVCLDKAFDSNDALKQSLDNTCKLYTI